MPKVTLKKRAATGLAALLASMLPTPAPAQDHIAEFKIRHIVAFKYKATTTQKTIEAIDAALLALKTKIPQVSAIEYGDNNSPEKMNKGLSQAFVITFEDRQSRDIYLDHPEHVKFKNFALPFIEDALVIDYNVPAKMPQVIDLTHVLGPNLPDFHVQPNAFEYKKLFTVAKNGFADGAFTTPEHYGTHMDAPSHFYDGAESIDQIAAKKLIAQCVVIDARAEVAKDENYRLTVEKIKAFEVGGQIPAGCVVVLMTGWEGRWSLPGKYRNADAQGQMHFPSFSAEALKYLSDERHVAGLGIDTLSLDYGESKDFPVHKLGLAKGMFFIENLANLDKLPTRGAELFMGPLRVKNGTGSPARILAELPTD